MKFLVDRHHHGLFYGLQLLLEDRLGGVVYTPIGHEWWDEGYWNFGRWSEWRDDGPQDRLAQQYLNMAGWEPWGNVYRSFDGHHPDRPMYGITLDVAKATPQDWTGVVATVQDNEAGFHRFAQEMSNRAQMSRNGPVQYIVQVGNTGQMVNWGLNPLALVSSEVPIRGRGVLMHQPFDHDTVFAYREPVKSKTIRSFVNCFGSTRCSTLFDDAQSVMPDWFFASHGIDGPNGNIETVREIAQLMAGSAWGWHDKEQGDGFGHVIHQWAAIGRPLIGHASHYRGRMAEGFWQDGKTCIDLDKHPIGEVAEIIRGTNSSQHRFMCEAIRAEFDKIDWDGEAEAVRDLIAPRMAVAA